MARYRVIPEGRVWLHFPSPDGPAPQLLRSGAEFSFDGWPNEFMVPLDDEARAAIKERDEHRQAGRRLPDRPGQVASGVTAQKEPSATVAPSAATANSGDDVEIPEDWRTLHSMKRVKIARALGFETAQMSATRDEIKAADELIESELERRAGAMAA